MPNPQFAAKPGLSAGFQAIDRPPRLAAVHAVDSP
jgi:hypothetical protein